MASAAKHLTPVLLELGGKSPVVVDSGINLQVYRCSFLHNLSNFLLHFTCCFKLCYEFQLLSCRSFSYFVFPRLQVGG